MGYHVDLVPGVIPKHSYPPAYRNHRLLKPPYLRLIGLYFSLTCLVIWAAPVAFGRWAVTCSGGESANRFAWPHGWLVGRSVSSLADVLFTLL